MGCAEIILLLVGTFFVPRLTLIVVVAIWTDDPGATILVAIVAFLSYLRSEE